MNHIVPIRCDAALVSLGLIDGTTQNGTLPRFLSTLTELTLEAPARPGDPRSVRHVVDAERVAYIAFARPAEGPVATAAPEAVSLKVQVTGGRSFNVLAPPLHKASGSVGFFAVPEDPAGPHRELFFYAHALVSVERNELLGEMLVARGMVTGAAVIEAAELQRRRKMRLGEVLADAGLVTPSDIEGALAAQKKTRGRRLGEILVEMGALTEERLTGTLAEKFHVPMVDLDAMAFHGDAVAELPRELIERYGVLPVGADATKLIVAFPDPLAVDAMDAVIFHCRKKVIEVLAPPTQLRRHVRSFLDNAPQPIKRNTPVAPTETIEALVAQATPSSRAEADASDGVIIRIANRILFDAVERKVSDIHVEPNGPDRPVRVRFRRDGDCIKYQKLPGIVGASLVARFKIMASLDISERRKPQDGKIKVQLRGDDVEFRLATLPTVNGNEDAVLRLLASSKPMPLDRAGLSTRNLRELRELIARPYGLILCVGPTGSGKTTTLHSVLGALNTPDMKIWTAEDPVEITQDGLRQVQMHSKIGLTFASAPRAFLRADPDVIMVGEMRDEETASTAVEASLTGHLVLSTLHTNSAPETLTRMLDMGLEPFSFADALLGVLAQRLARGLCPQCKKQRTRTREEHDEMDALYGPEAFDALTGGWNELSLQWEARGCERCDNTGYKGRVALHELLVTDDEIRGAITRHAPVAEVRAKAVAGGMTTLLQDGIEKALQGATDLKQVLAVCSR